MCNKDEFCDSAEHATKKFMWRKDKPHHLLQDRSLLQRVNYIMKVRGAERVTMG